MRFLFVEKAYCAPNAFVWSVQTVFRIFRKSREGEDQNMLHFSLGGGFISVPGEQWKTSENPAQFLTAVFTLEIKIYTKF